MSLLQKLAFAAALAASGCGGNEAPAPQPEQKVEKKEVNKFENNFVEPSESYHMPFQSKENYGKALGVMEKHVQILQDNENKLAAEQKREARKIEQGQAAQFYFGQQMNADKMHGVAPQELSDYVKARDWCKDAKAKATDTASMEFKSPAYVFDSQEDAKALNNLIAQHAESEGVENTPMFRLMVKEHIAKLYNAKKDGENVILTKDIIEKYGKEKPRFALPGCDPTIKEPAEVDYKKTAAVKCEDTLVFARAQEFVRVFNAYQKANEEVQADTNEAQTYLASKIAGNDGVLQAEELSKAIKTLESKLAGTGIEFKDYTVTDADTFTSAFEGKMPTAHAKQLDKACEKYNINGAKGNAYVIWLLKTNNGAVAKSDLDNALKTMKEDYDKGVFK